MDIRIIRIIAISVALFVAGVVTMFQNYKVGTPLTVAAGVVFAAAIPSIMSMSN